MSQLISLKQRIKAVEATKKITYAMRLISMSTHSRLRSKKNFLRIYNQKINEIIKLINYNLPEEEIFFKNENKDLAIIVSSQKGLCGVFNINNFRHFEQETKLNKNSLETIAVGKYAIDYLKQQNIANIYKYNNFTSSEFISIAQDLSNFIWENKSKYNSISIYSNSPQSFFIQKPTKFSVWPMQKTHINDIGNSEMIYSFEDSPNSLFLKIQKIQITNLLQEILINSLLAEQSARFLSMDISTRNAETLINEMKLKYNKSRQAAITRELTELSTGFF